MLVLLLSFTWATYRGANPLLPAAASSPRGEPTLVEFRAAPARFSAPGRTTRRGFSGRREYPAPRSVVRPRSPLAEAAVLMNPLTWLPLKKV